jgi:hypothetical protein
MGINDHTRPPAGAGASPVRTVDKAIELAESGDYGLIADKAFAEAVKAIRGQDEQFYLLKIKPRIKELKACPIGLRDLDNLTKPPRKPKQRYSDQTETGAAEPARLGKADLFIEMIRKWADVFSDDSGKPYACFQVEPTNPETGEILPVHSETWALDYK